MNVIVVCEEQGKIISLSRLGEIADGSSGVTGVAPLPGQFVHEIHLPEEFQKIPLLELHNKFCVDLKGEHPCFVRVQDLMKPEKKI